MNSCNPEIPDHIRDSYLDAIAMVRASVMRDNEAANAIWPNCCKPCVVAALSDMILALCDKAGITFRVFEEHCLTCTEQNYGTLKENE